MGKTVLLFFFGAVTFGCDSTAPHLSFAVEQRLLRETTLDDMPEGQASAADSIVRVTRTGRYAGACSGALIGPRHVLTAEHCMMKVDATRELTETEIYPGDVHVELGGDYLPWGRVAVREIHGCPGYTDDVAHDVAVLVLSKPVPADVPILDVSFAIPDQAGIYELGGFGSNKKPRAMPGTDWYVWSRTRHLYTGPILGATASEIAVQLPGVPGDSGGPILDVASGRVIAVVSRGRPDAEPSKEDPGGPLVKGPRLITCKKTIEDALAR
ncbi:MAG TPA: trypsin-like serine protease [Labilithrix sp.]